jgi:aryl-alcohol dehydrogenase-like predicted oxidoreductase
MDRFSKVAPIHTMQPPYNLFERGIESDVLPHCRSEGISTLVYGAICRGLLSGRMNAKTVFTGDDLRRTDPKFEPPRYSQYLEVVERLDRFARDNYGKRVIHLALRWVLDQDGVSAALWGARRPDQLDPVGEVMGWHLSLKEREQIIRIVDEVVTDPVGPEFMAPPTAIHWRHDAPLTRRVHANG